MTGEPILIIDDNPLNLELLTYLLSHHHYKIRTAMSAKEVLKILSTFQPKLILMDLQLKDMDGLDLTRKLKSDPKYQDITIIAVTARVSEKDKNEALNAGCSHCISKPIDVFTFPNIIAEYIVDLAK